MISMDNLSKATSILIDIADGLLFGIPSSTIISRVNANYDVEINQLNKAIDVLSKELRALETASVDNITAKQLVQSAKQDYESQIRDFAESLALGAVRDNEIEKAKVGASKAAESYSELSKVGDKIDKQIEDTHSEISKKVERVNKLAQQQSRSLGQTTLQWWNKEGIPGENK